MLERANFSLALDHLFALFSGFDILTVFVLVIERVFIRGDIGGLGLPFITACKWNVLFIVSRIIEWEILAFIPCWEPLASRNAFFDIHDLFKLWVALKVGIICLWVVKRYGSPLVLCISAHFMTLVLLSIDLVHQGRVRSQLWVAFAGRHTLHPIAGIFRESKFTCGSLGPIFLGVF
jgi:hypothetical protein